MCGLVASVFALPYPPVIEIESLSRLKDLFYVPQLPAAEKSYLKERLYIRIYIE
jgi:hypothetical protein